MYPVKTYVTYMFFFSFGSFVSCGAEGRVVCEIYTWKFRPGGMGPCREERDLVWEDRHNNVCLTVEL